MERLLWQNAKQGRYVIFGFVGFSVVL
jgi:hypothetical protein